MALQKKEKKTANSVAVETHVLATRELQHEERFFYKLINYSFIDVIAFLINKPNLITGGKLWISLVQLSCLILGVFFIVFMSDEHKAWGCYAKVYGSKFTINDLTTGECTNTVAPNIGSAHYTDFPISGRVYGFMIAGAILVVSTIAVYIYTNVRITHATHLVVHEDTDAIMYELNILEKTTGKPHKLRPKTGIIMFNFDVIYWWYFDVFAYFFNVPNQLQDGYWSLTISRFLLNFWSFYLWSYIYTNWAYDVDDSLYYALLVLPQVLSMLLYIVGLLQMHVWLTETKLVVIQSEIAHRTKNSVIVPLEDIRSVFNNKLLRSPI